jgi:hypothetical protein
VKVLLQKGKIRGWGDGKIIELKLTGWVEAQNPTLTVANKQLLIIDRTS